jgi:hypothetical protein
LSLLAVLLAGVLIIAPFFMWNPENPYFEPLNYIDLTTGILAGVLLLRGVLSLDQDSDLQAVSISLVGVVSCLFTYEALFKLSFYLDTFRLPPAELREFVAQAGIALTGLTGFAFGKFKISKLSLVFLGVFALGMAFWLAIGFPQLGDEQRVYTPLLDISLNWKVLYALNRATKAALCLVYFFFYQSPLCSIFNLRPWRRGG